MANAIDALLDRLDDPAGRLVLEVGRPPRIAVGDIETDVQETAMTQQDVVGLAMPVVPQSVRARLRKDPVVTFAYASDTGRAYDVEIRRDRSGLVVSFAHASRAPTADPTALTEPPPPAVADPTPAASSASPSVPAPDTAPPATAGPSTAIDAMFRAMCAAGASDLHLSVSAPPLLRLDGKMRPLDPDAAPLTPTEVERLVVAIMPQANKAEFERRHDTDFAYEIVGLARFRANVFLDRKGLGAVFRAIPAEIMTAEQLKLSPHILDLCHLSKGLVVVTGPTGSGKSTTLCAMIDYINKNRDDHIITIEDPIEFVHENLRCLINQREVGDHTDSFRDALRAALREDPDIILVGEMRDLETVAIAIETAETGHLVFGTLHTTTAASTVDRIIDQFPPDRQAQIRVMLSGSLRGVIAQNLCRKIGGGRVAALEVLIPNAAVSNLIREGKTFQIPSMMQVGRGSGMVILNDALMALVNDKVVEPQEAYLKAVDKEGLVTLFKRANVDTSFVLKDG
ncbi:MAG: PilT/PilU family type 4a pilus ATPase [Acidobacteria bacterium]|nr:PilT/PilU family type 4a pilus ATPase [Acidobacteriota bacterium]